MKLLILFFSGTGNTQFIAEYIKNSLLNSNSISIPDFQISLGALENVDLQKLSENDIICLGFPIYAGRSPLIVRELIEKLPNLQDKGFFVYNTKGLAQGMGNFEVIRRLKKKGLKTLSSTSIKMPGSDGICMFMKENSKSLQKLTEKNYEEIPKLNKFIRKIETAFHLLQQGLKVEELLRSTPKNPFGFLITGILWLLYGLIEKKMICSYRTDDTCNLCEICIQICPRKNIQIQDGRISFGDNCLLCLRCLNNCPQNSIQIGKITKGKARWHGPKNNYNPLKYKKPKSFP
jgi:ferredoxin